MKDGAQIIGVIVFLLQMWDIWMYSKAISVTGRAGPYGCEMSRLPHFLDNRLTDGGKVVSLTRRPPITPRKIPGTDFC
jgi:hypothetical protein